MLVRFNKTYTFKVDYKNYYFDTDYTVTDECSSWEHDFPNDMDDDERDAVAEYIENSTDIDYVNDDEIYIDENDIVLN